MAMYACEVSTESMQMLKGGGDAEYRVFLCLATSPRFRRTATFRIVLIPLVLNR